MPSPAKTRSHSPARQTLPPGSVLLALATLVASGTLGMVFPSGNAIYCDRMAPLTVLATVAAALIPMCFRALAAVPGRRRLLVVALLLAAGSLFASARFVARYHRACGEVQQRLVQSHRMR